MLEPYQRYSPLGYEVVQGLKGKEAEYVDLLPSKTSPLFTIALVNCNEFK